MGSTIENENKSPFSFCISHNYINFAKKFRWVLLIMSKRFLDFKRGQNVSGKGNVAGYMTDDAYILYRLKAKSGRNITYRNATR